jgi:hypothetical protein
MGIAWAIASVLTCLAVMASPASAAFIHTFQSDISTPECTPEDLAVDASGNLYARCSNNNTIAKFDSAGNPVNFSGVASYISGNKLTGWTSGGFSFDNSGSAAAVAVDTNPASPAFGYIYVATISGGNVGVFNSTGTFVGQIPNTAGGELCGVATNKQGVVFTGHYFGGGTIDKFTPTDATPGDDTYNGRLGQSSSVCYVAGDSTGAGYTSGWSSGPLIKYASDQFFPGGNSAPVGTLIQNTSLAMDVDPANDDIYVSSGSAITAYNSATAPVGPAFGSGHISGSRGVAVSDTNSAIYASGATGGGTVAKFSLQGVIIPDVTTNPAVVSSIGHKTADLTGHVDPAGGPEVTECKLQWGTNTSYSEVPVPCDQSVPFSTAKDVSASLENLTVNTTYHYRFVASNENGQSVGADQTFTTPAVLNVHTDAATNVGANEATLNGGFTIDAEGGDTTYSFQYGVDKNYGTSTPLEDAGSTPGDVNESTVVTGLHSGTTYHYRIVATSALLGTTFGPDQTFTTFQPPSIESVSSQNLSATAADLVAKVNPNGADTSYHFEYGLTPSYGSKAPIPDEDIGEGTTPQTVKIHIENLLAKQTYHFRLVAKSPYGEAVSEDQSFNFFPQNCPNAHVRQEVGANNLPDCRAYEIASAAYAGGDVIFPESAPNTGYATNPSRLFYTVMFGAIPGTGNPINSIGDLYTATRTSTGWVTKYIGLPASESFEMGPPPGEGQGGLLGQEPDKVQKETLSNPAQDRILNWDNGNPDFGLGGSNAPYLWDAEGNVVDRWPSNLGAVPNGEKFVGNVAASGDLTHFVFSSDVVFAPGGVPGDIYDNDTNANTVLIASKAENGDPLANASPAKVSGGFEPGPACAQCGGISSDGSHILMSAGGHLYMRVDGAATYDIAPGQPTTFVSMTSDGSKVYFTSTAQLTEDDTDTSVDLYMWSEATNSLTKVSAGSGGAGDTDKCSATWTSKCNAVPISFNGYQRLQGGVGGNGTDNFVAANNGDIYFLSPEQLDGTSNGFPGQENLYDYRNGHPQFVAALNAGEEVCTPDQGELYCSDYAIARMQVSPDDSHAAFITGSQLTSYDNAGHAMMYSYDPSKPPGQALTCDSCLPSGEPPTEDVYASENGLFMTNDGRTFFSTTDALVPQDTDQTTDVYEFVEGRPQLVTPGIGGKIESFGFIGIEAFPGLVGVSADGTDAFFATFDNLVTQDHNGGTLKIYDARVGGGFPAEVSPPGCAAADECHGAGSSAPALAPNGTGADLGGSGNVHLAKKHRKRHHRRHHKRHRQRHANKRQG